MRNLVLLVQFKKREKHPWMSATLSKIENVEKTQKLESSLLSKPLILLQLREVLSKFNTTQ